MRSMWRRLFRIDPGMLLKLSSVSLDRVRSIEQLSPNPLVYERTAFMEHIRRYDREALRAYYLSQPVEGADVWANYAVNLWEYEHGVDELTSYPWNITIPLTEVCNAICTFCSSPLVPSPKAFAVHEVEHFADALRYAVCISLQGLGEPLAHPQFEEIATAIKKHLNPVAHLEIITNGWLLSGHRWELLKSLRIRDIQVSVNAATDQTHQIAMGSKPGTFDRVVANIENIFADPDWCNLPETSPGLLKVSMVVTRHSLPEVPQFLDLFVKKGVENFQLNPLLPLTSPDWGFGRTDQYLDLWCGHLPNARELVEKATKAIVLYRRMGFRIIATPDQWLLPVSPSLRSNPIQLSTDEQSAAVFQAGSVPTTYNPKLEALCLWVNNRQVVLVPHEKYADVTGKESEGVRFRGTSQSCRWAYLLRTPRLELPAGEYMLDLRVEICSGQLYAGILDIEKNEFIVQQQLQSESTRIQFALAENRLIDVVVRQGSNDTPVSAIYRYGQLRVSAGLEEPSIGESAEENPGITQAVRPPELLDSPSESEEAPSPQASGLDSEKPGIPGLYKPSRIYCPMVYTTLSVFQHSLDVSICCYMENAPGERRPNLKNMPVLQAYNADGFKLVRRTLTTDRHLPVCDSCPYGDFRS
jgi:Radical SAM superfamily